MTMKKILFAILSVAVLASCSSDYLNTMSTSKIDEATVFSTTESARMAIEGLVAHTYYFSGTAPRMGYNFIILQNEVMGEDLMYSKKNAQWTTSAKWSLHNDPTSSGMLYIYRWFYTMIMNANTIIRNMEDGTVEGPQQEKDFIEAQALTYRAWCHFLAVQWYGLRYDYDNPSKNEQNLGVIIRTDNTGEPKARASVAEVYAQINADLDKAIELFAGSSVTRSDKANIDINVCRGIKARVLLTQGQWEAAAEMAKLVENGSGAKLDAKTYERKVGRGCDSSNSEWIWCQIAHEELGIHKYGQFYSYISNTNVSYNQNTPRCINNLLYARIPDTDVRKDLWLEDPTTMDKKDIVYPPSGNLYPWMSQKFIVCAIDNTSSAYDGSKLSADVPYMRLPEIILMEAEGYARAGKTAEAQQALDKLAKMRDPAYTGCTSTGEALIDEIMFQRRIELWGEGFRFPDLKRLHMDLDRGPKPRDGYNQGGWKSYKHQDNLDPLASNYNMYDAQEIGEENRFRDKDHIDWQFTIPQDEIDANPLCQQNLL